MAENHGNVPVHTVKTLKTKTIEFAVMYGIISMIAFSGADSVAHSVISNLSTFFTSDFYIDGADFSIFANMFAAPLYIAFIVFSIVVALVIEIILILILKKVYFKSVVIKEEKDELLKYIKMLLAGFALVGVLMAAATSGSLRWVMIFMLDYLPVPLITLSIVRTNFRKIYHS